MPPAWRCQIEAHKNNRCKGLDVRLSLAVALSTKQVTPHERTCGSTAVYTPMPQRLYTFTNIHTFSGNRTQALLHGSQRHLRLNGYLEYPYATKALYVYKHPRLLWDSNPDPTARHSASFAAQRLFRVPLCYKDTIRLQTSMPSPGFEPRP
ncbi:hypothetical protein TNCV_3359931 [Trichonephila clavipes]|nr:hypothetical protein TNCV_3359931 [Trichonephila clavipes]